MSDSPFRERRVAPEEVQRIVKRAAELAMVDPSAEKHSLALTTAELEQRLQDLGIAPEIARRAMEPPTTELVRSPDGAIRVEREVVVEGMLSPDRFEEIADAVASVMKIPGRTSAVGNKLTWSPAGLLLEPSVTVHAKDGYTSIRYVETLANRGQLTVGFGTLASLSGVMAGTITSSAGVAIAKAAEVSAASGSPLVFGASAVVGIAAAIGSFFGLKRMLARRKRSRTAFAEEVLAHVARAVSAATLTEPVKARVHTTAAAPEKDAEAEGELDAEAEAEAQRRNGA